ncbi:MAG: ribosomal protein L13e [archaeon]|nr:MAG: ribosomal protein L13e [archaeon]
MSAKPSKTKATKKSKAEPKAAKVAKVVSIRPSGTPPRPMVLSRHVDTMITREGRGFSMVELAGASVSQKDAWKWGVKLDSKRRSLLDHNVESLRKWASTAQKPKVAEPKPEPVVEAEPEPKPKPAAAKKATKKPAAKKKKA